ncbi:MAG TPA: hypothetical protein VGU25_15930 [Acidobacteriaceae bacterium]|nr:hypothetical protein [Acidobacteriaceae bacterium]
MATLWFRRPALLILATLALSASAQTTSPAYLADMPSVDRVKAAIQGTDPTDTLERQVAVLTYLSQYINRIKDPHAAFTPDESRVKFSYDSAAYQIQQDYNKTHTQAENGAFDKAQFNYMLNNGDQWARKLIGPQSAAAYQSTLTDMNTRQQAHINSINSANEAAKNAATSSSRGGSSNDPTTLAARRCAELGGTTGGCATKGLGQGMLALIGGDQIADEADAMQTVGVYLSGGWGSGGGAIGFTLNAAQIGCGKLVPQPFSYKLQRTASGVQVFVSSSPNMTLTLRPDGSLVGPGLVTISGRIIVGYNTSTTTLVHQDGSEASGCTGAYGSCRTTNSTPIYAPATARCNFATLAAPTPTHQATGAAAADGSFGGGLFSFMSSIVTVADPGLRMNGKFLSPTGLILDFEGDAVTMDCGPAHIKAPYTVQNAAGEFRVSVNNPGGPFTLALASDGTLHGSGSTTVNGKLYQSIGSDAQISFRPVSTTCAVNTFTSKSPTEYKALISNPPAPGR